MGSLNFTLNLAHLSVLQAPYLQSVQFCFVFFGNFGEDNHLWNMMVPPFSYYLPNILYDESFGLYRLTVNCSVLHVVHQSLQNLECMICWCNVDFPRDSYNCCRVSVSAPLRGRLVSRDPASAFQHHVSMWYNNGKMNHWLKAHAHTVTEPIAYTFWV